MSSTLMEEPRVLKHPGTPEPDRIQSGEGRVVEITRDLRPGIALAEAIEEAIEGTGIRSGAVRYVDLNLEPMRYVRPTFSSTPDHVAYYSHTHAPQGIHAMDEATATLGTREGRVFIHCHALWRDVGGRELGGHILPLEAIVAAPSRVQIIGTPDLDMRVEPDGETNFSLFNVRPVTEIESHAGGRRLVVAKIRPNEDLVTAIETIALRHGVRHARILSGIGSTVGAVFEDGTVVAEIPTEILVRKGDLRVSAAGEARLTMELALIDSDGRVHLGELRRGHNPVLICFELILEVLE